MSGLYETEYRRDSRLRYSCCPVTDDGKVDLLEVEPGVRIPLVEIPATQRDSNSYRKPEVKDLYRIKA